MAVAEEFAGASREASLPAAAPPEIAGSEPSEDQQEESSINSAPARIFPLRPTFPPGPVDVESYAGTQSEIQGYAERHVAYACETVVGPRAFAPAAIAVRAEAAAEEELMQPRGQAEP